MGREIKFRYRFKNRETNEMITANLSLQDVELQGITPNPFQSLDWDILSRDEFTGLLDKNGKPIYEGDIVNCHSAVSLVVAFGYGMFYLTSQGAVLRPHSHFAWGDTEVIGNIYENPELLKEEA